MKLVRGWEFKNAPENTGQIRLRPAAFYRDVELAAPGVRDEKEGKATLLAEASVSRDGGFLGDTTLKLHLNDGEDPAVVHLPEGVHQTSFTQAVPVDIHPVPYVFCTSIMPPTAEELPTLKNAVNETTTPGTRSAIPTRSVVNSKRPSRDGCSTSA
ncbi:MAG: hypothetical protein OXH52_22205 [Gammaproteobacteria bacterium]|nr:hypothetical protein [Gammaproteobacteria bacterium]